MRILSVAVLALVPLDVFGFVPHSLNSRHSVLNGKVQVKVPAQVGKAQQARGGGVGCLGMYVIDVNEDSPRQVEPFQEWANNYGIQRMDGLELVTEDGLDYEMMTSQDMPEGQTVVGVPADLILRASTCKAELLERSGSGGGVKDAVETMGRIGAGLSVPEFYLTVKLLVEYEKGSQSDYFPWLDALPRLYYNAVSMTDFCYECLPPLVFSLSREERIKFDNFCQVLKKVDDNVLSPSLKENTPVIRWAFNAVHTRAVSAAGYDGEPGQDLYLVPLVDMFNHGTDTEVDMEFDEEGNCLLYTTTDVPAGSPLRISYGCPTNPSAFFAKYGFLDESSPATFCKMMNIQSTPELVDIGFDFSRMLFFKETGDISEEVWDVVLYSKILANDPEMKRRFYEAHMNNNFDLKSEIHQLYFGQTVLEVKKHVDTFLTQLDELSNKAVGKDVNEHPRLPLILRHNDFVRQTFLTVQRNLEPMVAQSQQEPAFS